METVNVPYAHKRRQVSNGMLESRVPDRESQMRLRDHLLGPSQSGPIYRSQDPPASQDLLRTIIRRKIPSEPEDYCYLDQNSSSHGISREPVHTKTDGELRHTPLA
jgi:hypothetical protein